MPVGPEAENIFVEVLGGRAIVNDKAGMNDFVFVAPLSHYGNVLGVFKHAVGFGEADLVTLRVAERQILHSWSGQLIGVSQICEQIVAQSRNVVRQERDFLYEV